VVGVSPDSVVVALVVKEVVALEVEEVVELVVEEVAEVVVEKGAAVGKYSVVGATGDSSVEASVNKEGFSVDVVDNDDSLVDMGCEVGGDSVVEASLGNVESSVVCGDVVDSDNSFEEDSSLDDIDSFVTGGSCGCSSGITMVWLASSSSTALAGSSLAEIGISVVSSPTIRSKTDFVISDATVIR